MKGKDIKPGTSGADFLGTWYSWGLFGWFTEPWYTWWGDGGDGSWHSPSDWWEIPPKAQAVQLAPNMLLLYAQEFRANPE